MRTTLQLYRTDLQILKDKFTMIRILTCVIVLIICVNGFPEKMKEPQIDYDICKPKSINSFCKLASNDKPTVRQKCNGLIQKMKKISYPFKFYTRQDWNAEPATGVKPLTTPVPYVVIHHTYIPAACNTTEQCRVAMKGMQNYHKNTHDWGDIGYNFCIGSEGGVYEGRGFENLGVHAGKANKYSIGICLIGDWRTELPPSNQLEATTALIEAGVKRGYISPDYKLVGHKQIMSTECPGGALFHEISTWGHFVPVFEVPQH